jgi:hypothetical protein
MKKIFLSIIGILSIAGVAAQSELDAVKYVDGDIQGTARYMSMAGAFGALGGDASAIKDNPAGLGIYRGQELGITISAQAQNSNSDWNGIKANDNFFRTKLNTFSYVFATRLDGAGKGLVGMNFAFTYNKLKSIDRAVSVRGGEMQSRLSNMMADLAFKTGITNDDAMGDYNNTSVGWLSALGRNSGLIYLDNNLGWLSYFGYDPNSNKMENVVPTYSLYEKGYTDEYAFTWSGNFSNRFYLGIGINLQSMAYDLSSVYTESTVNDNFTLTNIYSASGFGLNVSVGGLFKITDALRASASIHTPTAMFLTEYYYPTIHYAGNEIGPEPASKNNYVINRPFYANLGLAYIFGKKGLISAEYVFTNYKGVSYADEDENKQSFAEENAGMKDMFLNGHTIKVGGEYRVNNNFSVRAGYAMQTSMVDENKADKLMSANSLRTDAEYFVPKNTNYFTLGIGYQEKGWYFDLAVMHKRAAQTFMPFSPVYQVDYDSATEDFVNILTPKPAEINISSNNIVATFGLRF